MGVVNKSELQEHGFSTETHYGVVGSKPCPTFLHKDRDTWRANMIVMSIAGVIPKATTGREKHRWKMSKKWRNLQGYYLFCVNQEMEWAKVPSLGRKLRPWPQVWPQEHINLWLLDLQSLEQFTSICLASG